MPTDDTYIDGCGVLPDEPIGTGTRIRFRLTEDPQQDVSVYLHGGVLHIAGQYRPVRVLRLEENHVDITTKVWRKPNVQTEEEDPVVGDGISSRDSTGSEQAPNG